MYRLLDGTLKQRIYNLLRERDLVFKTTSAVQFENKLFKIQHIRNCIAHNNSLTVLIRYFDIRTGVLRKKEDKKRYIRLLEELKRM